MSSVAVDFGEVIEKAGKALEQEEIGLRAGMTYPGMDKEDTKAELESRKELLDALKRAQSTVGAIGFTEMQNLIAKAEKLEAILDGEGEQSQISLADSVEVKQEGDKYTINTKPPRADMTLMDVFDQLGDKVDIDYIRHNLKSVDLNEKLGDEEIELIVFDEPGTQEQNHAFIEEQGLSLEVDPKRVLYMAAVLHKKDIDGNLNDTEANLYKILTTRFIRFGSGSAGVDVSADGVLLARDHCHPGFNYGVPCAARSESK